jgi:formylglycine-generating enzyme required for sulfatase activity
MATTIYLSSTYEDLKDYRLAVFEALRKSGYYVIAMEDYVATDQRPVDKCLNDVEKADLYVGLFAFRYGYIPPANHNNPNGWSITELEFRHADRLKKPCLIFLADHKQTGIPQQFVDAFTSDGDAGEKIKRLREYLVRERMASFFSSPYQLASLVLGEVTRYLADNPKAVKASEKSKPAKPQQESQAAPEKRQTGRGESREFRWRTWIGRGVRIVVFATGLVILVLGAWELARWGLDELSASAMITRNSSLCEAVPGLGPEMMFVEGGKLEMQAEAGSVSRAKQAAPIVTVKFFAIGTCEVTFEEYDRFVKATKRELPNDKGWGRGRRPVINVSWDDAVAYAKWLSQETGNRYRLPTESEWEYAARSGGKDEIWAGTSDERLLKDYAVFERNLGEGTEPVGSKKANGLGLYDMSGNVWEWVEGCFDKPTDETSCRDRVGRGGSWFNSPVYLRTSVRGWDPADTRNNDIGFRLVQDIGP